MAGLKGKQAGDHAAAPRQLDDATIIPFSLKSAKQKARISITPRRRRHAVRELTNRANQTAVSDLNRTRPEALTFAVMDDATIETAVSRFLKSVGASAHREIEKAVRKALASGAVREGETLTVGVNLANEKLDLDITIFNKIEL
jgi:hypothetical protein